MTTIRDVARRAGVSKSAVSRVINDQPYVADDIRAKVQTAIDELGFRPNLHARSLRTARTHVLGLLVPTLGLPAVAEILQGTSATAHEHGYLLAISDAHGDATLWSAYLDNLLERRIDGLICYDSGSIQELLRPVFQARIPTIVLNRSSTLSEPGDATTGSLVFDFRPAYADALGDLTDHGHDRIALITSRSRSSQVEILHRSMVERGLPFRAELVIMVDGPDDARRAVDRLMKEAEPPTALIVQNAYNASAVGNQILDRDLRVPRDISLISIGESDWTKNMVPEVNVILAPFRASAASATELLIRRIGGDESVQLNLTREATYVRRGSVGPAPDRGAS